MTSSRRWQREKILTRGKIENEDVEYSRHPIDEKCWPMAHTIHVDILRHPRTKIGVEYVHALKMVDRSRERIVSLVFKDTTGRGIFGSRSVIRPSHEFVRRCFFTREFRADTNTFNQPSHPSQLVGDAFLSLPRAGGSLARLPTLVTKTNGMYLFHGTPASGFLLSPLCIALVKHFFLSSSLSPRLSSSFFFSPLPLSHRSVVLSSSIFPFRPSRASSLHSRSYSPFPDLSRRAALLEASARARFARENGPHTAETTRRNRRREERIGVATKEFGIARILNENSRVRGRRGR